MRGNTLASVNRFLCSISLTKPSSSIPTTEVWRPVIGPEDDMRMTKPFPLGRRNSPTDIRSTGVRPSIVGVVSEGAVDMMEIAKQQKRDQVQLAEKDWELINKVWEGDRQGLASNEGQRNISSDHSKQHDNSTGHTWSDGVLTSRPP
jgi:hypothetical protein